MAGEWDIGAEIPVIVVQRELMKDPELLHSIFQFVRAVDSLIRAYAKVDVAMHWTITEDEQGLCYRAQVPGDSQADVKRALAEARVELREHLKKRGLI